MNSHIFTALFQAMTPLLMSLCSLSVSTLLLLSNVLHSPNCVHPLLVVCLHTWYRTNTNSINLMSIIVQQDATIYRFYYISADSSTCFGWYHHPSSGARSNCNYNIWHWSNRIGYCLLTWRSHSSRWPATLWVHYTTNCNTQSTAPEDG